MRITTVSARYAPPYALSDARLSRHNVALQAGVGVRQAVVEHLLEQRRIEVPYEQEVVGCDRPYQTFRKDKVSFRSALDLAGPNGPHHGNHGFVFGRRIQRLVACKSTGCELTVVCRSQS